MHFLGSLGQDARHDIEVVAALESLITCPYCSFARAETIPSDSCLYFYQCTNCSVIMQPKPGDCCVFCSFGDVKCPFMCRPGEGPGATV